MKERMRRMHCDKCGYDTRMCVASVTGALLECPKCGKQSFRVLPPHCGVKYKSYGYTKRRNGPAKVRKKT